MFIAPSMGGKSTLTDFFIQQGHGLISDDKVPTVIENGQFLAGGSHPYHRPHRRFEELGYHVDNFISTLPSSIKSTVIARRARKPLRVELVKKGAFYAGFWGRSFGKYGRSYDPTITLTLPVNEQTTAHETGHYLIHLLIGDDLQSALEL